MAFVTKLNSVPGGQIPLWGYREWENYRLNNHVLGFIADV
jgi:hypothetical protein